MAWKIGMPSLGHTMEEGRVAEWLRTVGDPIARGDLIAVVESDKVTVEIEAPADGTLLRIAAPAGAVVAVGGTIGWIGVPGEVLPEETPAGSAASRVAPTPPAPIAAPPYRDASRRPLASPLARRVAAELGVDLAGLTASDPDGLISRADVVRAAVTPPRRAAIAARMAEAWATIPAVPLLRSVDLSASLALRLEMQPRPSVTALLLRATALALRTHPRLNAWWQNGPRPRDGIDIAVAVDTPDGLTAPTLAGADRLALPALAAALASLAAAARAGRIPAAAAVPASFTLSNLGGLGVDSFVPIITLPQVAVLGAGRVQPDGTAALSLVIDHRALDGADGARFLATLAALLADPAALI